MIEPNQIEKSEKSRWVIAESMAGAKFYGELENINEKTCVIVRPRELSQTEEVTAELLSEEYLHMFKGKATPMVVGFKAIMHDHSCNLGIVRAEIDWKSIFLVENLFREAGLLITGPFSDEPRS